MHGALENPTELQALSEDHIFNIFACVTLNYHMWERYVSSNFEKKNG